MISLPRSARLALLGVAAVGPALAVAWPAQGRLRGLVSTVSSVEGGEASDVARLESAHAALRIAAAPLLLAAERAASERVPTRDSRADRLLLVAAAAELSGVRVRSAEELPELRPAKGKFALAGLKVEATCDFAALATFAETLEGGIRIARIERLEIKRDAAFAPRLFASLVVRFPVRSGGDAAHSASRDHAGTDDNDDNDDNDDDEIDEEDR